MGRPQWPLQKTPFRLGAEGLRPGIYTPTAASVMMLPVTLQPEAGPAALVPQPCTAV
jgi:hypothetical protein